MTQQNKNISPKAWGTSFMRSFMIQAVWNGERMQNIGFAYSIIPLLNENVIENPEEILASHLEFFNTHPYMASAMVGAVGRMEVDRLNPEEIRAFKRGLMGPFGALGDSLFWSSLKPVATLVGVSLALGGRAFLAVAVTLILYNTLHLWTRLWGFWNGVNLGRWMVYRFTRIRFGRLKSWLAMTAILLLAVMTTWGGHFGGSLGSMIDEHEIIAGALAAGTVLFVSESVRRGMSAEKIFYMAAVLFLAAFTAVG